MSQTQTIFRTKMPASAEEFVSAIYDPNNPSRDASYTVGVISRYPNIRAATLEITIEETRKPFEQAGRLIRQTIGEQRAEGTQVSFLAVIVDVASFDRVTRNEDIRLDIDAAPELPSCSPHALHAAVLTVLLNAHKPTCDGATILLRAAATSLGPEVAVAVCVTDSDVGIEPDTVVRAFNPSFATRHHEIGGVGLQTVEDLVRDAGTASLSKVNAALA